jgi:thioredoxin 1
LHSNLEKQRMTEKTFIERLHSSPRPVVVDFWASWCVPCRAIAPVVEKLGAEYTGSVDLWKVNADEQPELLRSLHIYGIPTLVAFHKGEEVGRHSGVGSARVLGALFEASLRGKKVEQKKPALNDRFLRLGAGLALVALGIFRGLSGGVGLLLAGLGGVIMFSAVYDRCPIYRMVSARLKELFQRESTNP